MPNIIVNNYCNQKCSYCFANANMSDLNLQKNMSLKTYLEILKYLKKNNEKEVRILGGEPLLFENLHKFLLISEKGNFSTILFSNLNLDSQKFKSIFQNIHNIRVNININAGDFYTEKEKRNIQNNIETLQKLNIPIILSINILLEIEQDNFILFLAQKYSIKNINLKITNSSLGGDLLIDNTQRKLGIYIYQFIKTYYSQFFIEISCGLDKSIFTSKELSFIGKEANIKLKYGCDGNIGKIDFNTDGSIFKCYPLESLFLKKKIYVHDLLEKEISLKETIYTLNEGVYSCGECHGNKTIKSNI